MSESEDVTTFQESEQDLKSEDTSVWEPVGGGDQDYNDYPLAFVNVDKEDDSVMFNVDGEDVEPGEGRGPMIVGRFKGIKDISAEDNPEPSIKVLVESDSDERTYALNKVTALERQLEEIDEGQKIGLDFDGYVQPENSDGLPWQDWQVYLPA